MTAMHVGTSGYTYPEWKGSFYPSDLPASKMLAYYAERFSTVEVNYTFRRMPTAKVLAGWAAVTPVRFVFFKHEESASGPALARRFEAMLGA